MSLEVIDLPDADAADVHPDELDYYDEEEDVNDDLRRLGELTEIGRLDDCDDSFGESGTPDQLMEKYGLTANAIVEKALKVIARKK
jgi:hypothetical protein